MIVVHSWLARPTIRALFVCDPSWPLRPTIRVLFTGQADYLICQDFVGVLNNSPTFFVYFLSFSS